MSVYTEAVQRPREFGKKFGALNEDQGPDLPFLSTVIIRSGGSKGELIGGFLSARHELLPVTHVQATWDEDANKTPGMSQNMIAVHKTLDAEPGFLLGAAAPERSGWVASVATDVRQYTEGLVLDKPRDVSTLEEMETHLTKLLGGDGERNFGASASTAVLAKDPGYPDDKGRGLVMKSSHNFSIHAFTPDEIEYYMYGLKGRDGTYPETLQGIHQGLIREMDLNGEESTLLENGLTLKELKSTSGGLRWLHPLFTQHIASINGALPQSEEFQEQMSALFLTLMGSPKELDFVLQQMNNADIWDNGPGGSLFRELADDWKELAILNSGELAVIQSMTENDIPEISAMAVANLLNGGNHSGLTESQKALYAQANTPDQLANAFRHDRNRLIATIHVVGDGLVGFILTRQAHEEEDTLQIKRLHTKKGWQNGKGIGGKLLNAAVEYGGTNGYSNIFVEASGNSHTFFARHGFDMVREEVARTGVFEQNNDQPKVTHMRRVIN